MIIFGIDPGSDRTGYGCVQTDGSRHRLLTCGAIKTPASAAFPEKLLVIHSQPPARMAQAIAAAPARVRRVASSWRHYRP